MRNQNENKDLKQKINLYLDHALGAQEQEDLFQKVDNNPNYKEIFNAERNSRSFIKNGIKRQSVSPDLIQTIKNNIRIR